MVKVELTYNPYLMKTEVLFDGRKPRINSLVEKYKDKKLQDWINKIPNIFYNEMNGYGFELEFSGTEMDYQQLVKAFRDAGVTEDQVVLFHKNELGEREQKVRDLDTLITWLSENENSGIFRFKEFQREYGEVLNSDYTFIVLNGNNLMVDQLDQGAEFNISVENVESVEELKDADLENTPILICVTRTIMPQLQTIILNLKQREDVTENQLYFIISPYLNKDMAKRTIRDLGVRHLQIVDSPFDTAIRDFYYAYPVTDHLFDVLRVLSDESSRVRSLVEIEKQESEVSNVTVHKKIRELDEIIESLKSALINIESRDNVELPDTCIEAQKYLRWSIENWRKNKIKFSEEYAEKNSYEFEKYLNENFQMFIDTVIAAISKQRYKAIRKLQEIYGATNYDDFGKEWPKENNKMYELPLVAEDLKKLKEEQYIDPKSDFRDLFFRENDQPKELVLSTTYYCKEWREYAADRYIPLTITIINEQYDLLKKGVDTIAREYVKHLGEAIFDKRNEKEVIVSQLSSDELMLEKDIDWITTFVEAVEKLERG